MKKIYAALATLLLGAASSQAAITVTLEDGTPVADGETIIVDRDAFTHTYWEGLIDEWKGKIDINVESTTPTQVKLTGTNMNIMFCPVGENCYTLFETTPGVFEGDGTLRNSPIKIAVDINYYDCGENLPQETNSLQAVFIDSANEKYVVNFIFDTKDSGVDGIGNDDLVNAYSIAGYKVLDAAPADALRSLPAGLYIVNGKKTIIR